MRLRFNYEKLEQLKGDAYFKYTKLTAPNATDDEKVDQYINYRAVKLRLASQVTLDFYKAYKRLENNLGMFSDLPENVGTVNTAQLKSRTSFYADALKDVINPAFIGKLDTRISALNKTLGYYPGINWKLMGYSSVAGVLAVGLIKVGVMKLVSTILAVGAFGFVIASIGYGCFKACSRDPQDIEINTRLKNVISEETECQKHIQENLMKDETLTKVQNTDPKPYLDSLYKWSVDYKEYYKKYVDCVEKDMGDSQHLN